MENSKYTFGIEEPDDKDNQDNEWLRALVSQTAAKKAEHAGRKIARNPLVSSKQIRGIRYGK